MNKFLHKTISKASTYGTFQEFVDALNSLGLEKLSFSAVTFASPSNMGAINIYKDGVFLRCVPMNTSGSNSAVYFQVFTDVVFFGDEDGAWVIAIGTIENSNSVGNTGIFCGCFEAPNGDKEYLYIGAGNYIYPMKDVEATPDATYTGAVYGELAIFGNYSSNVVGLDDYQISNGSIAKSGSPDTYANYEPTIKEQTVLWPLVIRTGHLVRDVYGSNKVAPTSSALYRRMTIGTEEFVQIGRTIWARIG